jgi:hypothetical protein
MSPELCAWLIGGITVGVAIAGGPAAAGDAPRRWPSIAGLGGLIAALLLVGVVSGTVVRHLVQFAPAMMALALVARHSPFGRAAALPILPFWLALMLTIWRYLLGYTQSIGGHFTTAEIVLTMAIALVCAFGLAGGARPTANLPRLHRAVTAIVFGALQLGALWLSMQPFAFMR